MGWLDGKVALITGGGGGIGGAVAERFLREGARVLAFDRDVASVELFRRRAGALADGLSGDVTSWDDNRRAVERALLRFGRLDVFVGNAGVYDFFKPLCRLHGAEIGAAADEIFGINVKGCMLGARAAVDALTATRGSMIFTVSNSGLYAGGGGPLYVSSKHAVVGLVRQLAHELAPAVRVNGVAPGATRGTRLAGLDALGHSRRRVDESAATVQALRARTPLDFIPEAADHAGAYVFLASHENSRAITGAVIASDGGWEVRALARR